MSITHSQYLLVTKAIHPLNVITARHSGIRPQFLVICSQAHSAVNECSLFVTTAATPTIKSIWQPDLAQANGSVTYTKTRRLSVEPACLPCLLSLAPELIGSRDISLPTIKVRRAGKDVFRGSLARANEQQQHRFISSLSEIKDLNWVSLLS